MTVTTYPRRPQFFAHRYCRLLAKTCAAQDIGHIAFCLCVTIAHQEDAKRYRGPVTYYCQQLMPLIGVAKWESLDRARRRAVEANWLHYEAGNRGLRKPGRYWVTIPAGCEDVADTPCDESQSPLNGRGSESQYPPKGDREGDREGDLPTLYPTPNPSPEERSPRSLSRPSDDDRQLALWMVDRISEIQKPAHVPDVEKWANTVRLMRECDGRTLDEIRQLFDWANQDDFWRANIRSPDKLRKQWDTLTIQRTRHKANGRKQTVCTTGFYHDPARSKDSSHGKWD